VGAGSVIHPQFILPLAPAANYAEAGDVRRVA
jgi:hypothetical protein